MALAYGASGGVSAYVTNSPTPSYPTGITAGQVLVALIYFKPATSGTGTVTTPTGWTLQGSTGWQGGYGGAAAADTGDSQVFVYTKDTVSGSESGTVTFTTTGGNVVAGVILRFTNGGGAISYGFASGGDSTSGTPMSITCGSDPGITNGDMLVAAVMEPTDVGTAGTRYTSNTITATGATIGTATKVLDQDTTANTDASTGAWYASCTAGTATAAPAMSIVISGTNTNSRGPGALLRIREGATTQQGAATMTAQTTFTAGGTVGTAYRREVEHFDGLADGAAITTTTGIFDSGSTTGVATVVADLDATLFPGQPTMVGSGTAADTWTRQIDLMGGATDHTPQSHHRTYFKASRVAPTSVIPICSARNSAGSITCQLVLTATTGLLRMRNTQTPVGTGVALTADTWYRIEWRLDWNAQAMRLRVWTGATIHSDDTADCILNEVVTWDSAAGPPQHVRWGQGAADGTNTTLTFSALGWQTTDWLWAEPLANLSGEGVQTAVGTHTPAGGTTHQGAATMTGEGVQTAAGTRTQYGATAVAGDGATTAAASRTTYGASTMTGDGTLSAAGTRRQLGAAAVSGDGTLTAAGSRTQYGAAALAGDGTLAAAGARTAAAAAAVSGQSSLTAAGSRTAAAAATMTADGGLSSAGTRTQPATASLSGQSDLSGTGTRGQQGQALYDAASALTAAGSRTAEAAATLAGEGILYGTATGAVVHQGAAAFSGASGLAAGGTRGQGGAATLAGEGVATAAGLRRVSCLGTFYATSFPSTLDGWGSYAGAAPTWDGTEGHDALGALKVVLATNGGGWGVSRAGNVNSIRWGAGESFTASCWVKGTLTGGALRFYVQHWNAANGIILTTTVGTDVTKAQLNGGGWWQITGTGTTPANTVRSTLIVVITTTDTGTFWVDDVQLVQTPQLTAQSNLTPAGTRRAAAAAQLAGDGTMAAAATRGQQAAAALAGDGTMAAAAGGVQYGDATLSAQTSLTAAGTRTHQAAATVSAQTSMTAAATHTHQAAAQLSGQASMVAAATRRVSGAVEQLAGASSCTAAGVRTQPGTAALAGDGSATAAGTARGPYASIDVEVQGDAQGATTTGDQADAWWSSDAVTADLDSDGSGVSVQGGASGLGS